jgi:hypothetical protein
VTDTSPEPIEEPVLDIDPDPEGDEPGELPVDDDVLVGESESFTEA